MAHIQTGGRPIQFVPTETAHIVVLCEQARVRSSSVGRSNMPQLSAAGTRPTPPGSPLAAGASSSPLSSAHSSPHASPPGSAPGSPRSPRHSLFARTSSRTSMSPVTLELATLKAQAYVIECWDCSGTKPICRKIELPPSNQPPIVFAKFYKKYPMVSGNSANPFLWTA